MRFYFAFVAWAIATFCTPRLCHQLWTRAQARGVTAKSIMIAIVLIAINIVAAHYVFTDMLLRRDIYPPTFVLAMIFPLTVLMTLYLIRRKIFSAISGYGPSKKVFAFYKAEGIGPWLCEQWVVGDLKMALDAFNDYERGQYIHRIVCGGYRVSVIFNGLSRTLPKNFHREYRKYYAEIVPYLRKLRLHSRKDKSDAIEMLSKKFSGNENIAIYFK